MLLWDELKPFFVTQHAFALEGEDNMPGKSNLSIVPISF